MFTHERGILFHGEEADLTCSVLSAIKGLLIIYMYLYFHDLISKEGGVCREKLDHQVKRKLRMCVFVCVRVECVITIFYIPQAPMKRVWNALLPQIYITEQCESLCKRQIIFEKFNILVTC